MPTLAAIAAPSSALRAKDVVISWSPLMFPRDVHSRAGMRPPALEAVAAARTSPGASRVLDWKAPVDSRLGLSGAVSFAKLYCYVATPSAGVHPVVARLYCSPPELPADARPQEDAVDRHAASGPERAAALHVLRRAVRAFFQHRRTRPGRGRAVSRRDELDPCRHHHARPLRRHLHHRAARQAPGAGDQ